ncbi:integral membrane sensor signal transduction histidine kinase [Thermaerobacter marianensis DSM 12885]|uniref:histidine kinase n=1 Tax=Thermaerobacter marianensis (strain ATCC 700841 / DSM 12885 / JCM 10246 / 7p75a) TaxID=644966 RepID=E6SJW6_THEM7|nr:histidine kinase [Thermaerobacter marianensis]ADU52199.1 integral membrane sensor signal transduction histidine kinase [Thermaerobacter marianensis DSM 12885]
MDPWKLEQAGAGEEPGFHLTRLVLFAAGTAAWLLANPAPLPAVTLALAGILVLEALLQTVVLRGWDPDGAEGPGWAASGAWLAALGMALWTVHRTREVALVGPVAAVAMGAAAVLGRRRARWSNAAAGPQGALLAGAVLLAAAWSGDLHAAHRAERRRLERAVAELAAAQARLAELAARSGEVTARREREELLGSLHDALGHALTAQLLQVSLAGRLLPADPQGAAARLEAVEQGLREGLDQVRQLLRRSLHPARLPLAAAVRRLADDFAAASGVGVRVVLEPDATAVSDVDGEVAAVVYRAVQEALTNAARHGRARRVAVRLVVAGPRLRLFVQDDGAGAATLVPGMGLGRLTAAVQRVGGTVRFETAAGRGFAVEIGVPRRLPAGWPADGP